MFLGAIFRLNGWRGILAIVLLGLVVRAGFYIKDNRALLTRPSALTAGWSGAGNPAPLVSGLSGSTAVDTGASAWVNAMDDDADTGERVYRAKLSADTAPAASADAGQNISQLELRQSNRGTTAARLMLARVSAEDCAAITAVQAHFDHGEPRAFKASADMEDDVCTVAIRDFAGFRDAILNAEVLRTVPVTAIGQLAALTWHVGGLAWDVN